MTVGFHPAAEEEFRVAASYYESRVAGLGEEFIVEVEHTCRLLEEFPDLGPRLDLAHRRLALRRFPFALIYRIDGSEVSNHRNCPRKQTARLLASARLKVNTPLN
jgi:hypothetical protein